ncbi:MAG TPA: competence/damage-inducible protein A [Phycisphaerales bacterium]|nr:competence/damage-inducible protein A [Phycisphaerales bacterium]
MSHHATAAVVSVGDELTLGQTLDTNSKWISDRLVAMGIVPIEHVTVPDDLNAHVAAFTRLAQRVDVIICSGGLGPTQDDLTRDALAQAMSDTLIEDPIALAQVEAWYTSRGRVMSANNRLQALRPTRGAALQNLHGTAPGLAGRVNHCDIFCLPGPPRELFPMFDQHVAPRLRLPPGRTVVTRVLHTFGVAESDLAQRLGPLMQRDANPLVGTTASGGVVSIRMRYEGPLAHVDAESLLDSVERTCRDVAGAYIFGAGTDTLASVVVSMLRAQGRTVGTVESCTGGLLGSYLTEIPGSSAAFIGGLVTYTNALKTRLAHVDAANFAEAGPGAVSKETARAMAVGGLRTLDCDHALAITGIAGPDGGTAAKPVGLVYIACATRGDDDVDVRAFKMLGERQNVREWSAKTAMAMLWQKLSGLPTVKMLRETH